MSEFVAAANRVAIKMAGLEVELRAAIAAAKAARRELNKLPRPDAPQLLPPLGFSPDLTLIVDPGAGSPGTPTGTVGDGSGGAEDAFLFGGDGD